jgi:vacuolar-type H+-ATPase subunit C/Vma6
MIYSNVVASYLEGRLLDAEKLRRIAEADYFDALKMLYDYGYGEGLPIENADSKTLAECETKKLVEFVEEYACSENLKKFLLLRYLYNNLKSAVKSRFTSVDDGAYFPFFQAETEKVKDGDYELLSAKAKQALEKIDETVKSDGEISSFDIDIILNYAYYDEMFELSKKLNKSVKNFVVYTVDKNNLLTVFRAKRAALDEKTASDMFLPHGKIAKENLTEMLTASEERIRELSGEYSEEIEELISGELAVYEKNADDKLFLMAATDRQDMLSLDPFVGYFFAKKREIEAVKLILTCIKNDARDDLRRRLRNLDE